MNSERKRVNAKVRQGEALRLRSQGKTYRQVADALGFRGPSGAHKSVMAALRATLQEPATELRALESERLDWLWAALWPRAARGEPQAAQAALRVSESRRKLWGADAPTKLQLQEVLRSEDWQRVKGAVVAALVDWPEARERVIEGLRGLGDD